jgi:VCBS repeat-containing protein
MARYFDLTDGPTGASDAHKILNTTDPLLLPDGIPLFEAQFEREGHDLVLSQNGEPVLVVPGYFMTAAPVDLVCANGAVLPGKLAARLAGSSMDAQYAQLGEVSGPVPIGQVETISGLSTVQRSDGTVEELGIGLKIYQNDIISTTADGKVSVTFSDGTIFSLAQSSRMVIDNLVYDPDGSENASSFSLLTGGFVFIAGQVAKTGDMEVNTPTATMGIRGTTVQATIEVVGGVATLMVSLNRDPDGGIGSIELTDLDGNLIALITTTDTTWIVSPIEGQTREVVRTESDFAADSVLLGEAFNAYRTAIGRIEAGETFVELGGDSDGGSDEDNEDDPQTEDTPPPAIDDLSSTPNEDQGSTGEEPQNNAPPSTTPQPEGSTGSSQSTNSDRPEPEPEPQPEPEPNPEPQPEPEPEPQPEPEPESPPDPETPPEPDPQPEPEPEPEPEAQIPVPTAIDVAVAGSEDATEGEPIAGSVTAPNAAAGPLTYQVETPPTSGTVSLDPETGTFTYIPDPDFAGEDTFTYTVTNSAFQTDTGQVTITVENVNDAPTIEDAELTSSEDGGLLALDLSKLAQDLDANETLEFSIGNQVGGGTFSLIPAVPIIASPRNTIDSKAQTGDLLTFDPGEDFQSLGADQTGTSSIEVTVKDAEGATATSTITVTVQGANDVPVFEDITISRAEDDGVFTMDLTEYASDADANDTLTFSPLEGYEGNGEFTLNGSKLTFDPGQDFLSLPTGTTGTASIQVTVKDAAGEAATSTVTISAEGVNQAPIITKATLPDAVEDGGPVSLGLLPLVTDTDPNDTQEFSLGNQSGDGQFSLSEGETGPELIFNPGADFQSLGAQNTGTASIDVTVKDAAGEAATSTVSVTVQGANDAPIFAGGALPQAVEDGSAVSLDLSTLATDPDAGDALTFTIAGYDGEGSFSLSGSTLTFDPGNEFQYLETNGTTTVTTSVTVTDSSNVGTTSDVTVLVTGQNDAPIANSDAATMTQNLEGEAVSITIDVLANDFDYDRNASITLESVSDPQNGTAVITESGTVQYTPNSGFSGFDSFSYDIKDQFDAPATSTATIFVQEQQDAPPDGFSASVSFSVDGTAESPAGSLGIETLGVDPNQVQIAFVLDSSGSIGSSNWNTIENSVADAVSDLGDLFVGSQTEFEATVIQYSSKVNFNESYTIVSPGDTKADTTKLETDFTNDLVFTGGGTNWDAAFDATKTYFDADTADAIQVMYFVTDGNPNNSAANGTWDQSAETLRADDVDINVFAIGNNVDAGNINLIEGNPAGTPVNTLSSAADLTGSLAASPLFNPTLTSFSMDLVSDGVLTQNIADKSALTQVSGLSYDLALAGINGLPNLLGDSNQFIATAVYNVGTATTVEIVEVGDLSKFDTAQVRDDGTAGSDLMLGSDFADTVDGGSGSDLIMTYAGDDETLVSGDTAVALDGGDGQDVLSLLFDGTIDLQDLNAKNIETLDLTNGTGQTLTLTLDDVLGLSNDGNLSLNALLAANGITDFDPTQTTTILGDTGDTVEITLTGDQQFAGVGDPAGYDDGAGNTIVAYQIQSGLDGGFDILATLGIDADVVFQSAVS